MNSTDIRQCRRFIVNLQALIRDANGGLGYRQYADKVIEDISGLSKFATKILASANPLLAAQRIMTHPASRELARIFYDPNCQRTYQALNDLVICYYQAAQLALKPKRERNDRDIRAWKYLRKLYRNGVETIRENYGYNRSAKKMYKEQFSSLRDYTRGSTGGSILFSLNDDDDDFDDEDDDDDDLMIPKSQISSGRGALSQRDMELLRSFQGEDDDEDEDDMIPQMQQTPRSRMDLHDIDYDFSGKATLELIADRMATLTEGVQLILNRLYGQSITVPTEDGDQVQDDDDSDTDDILHEGRLQDIPFDDDDPKQVQAGLYRLLQGDFSDLTRSECIKLFNTLGNELAHTAEALAAATSPKVSDDTDEESDLPAGDPVTGLVEIPADDDGNDSSEDEEELSDPIEDVPDMEGEEDESEEEDLDESESDTAVLRALRDDGPEDDDQSDADESTDQEIDPELPASDESAADAFNRLIAPSDDT